jgi:chromosomal replication initiator protein
MVHDPAMRPLTPEEQWQRVRSKLRDELGDRAYQNWLHPLTLTGIEGGEVKLAAPSRFLRDWVLSRYGERIRTLWSAENPAVLRIGMRVASGAPPVRPTPATPAAAAATPSTVPANPAAAPGASPAPVAAIAGEPSRATPPRASEDEDDALSSPLNPRLRFNTFVIGKPNEFAYAAAHRVAEANSVAFNPLYLYGGVGLGKTHLMHAIAWHIREREPSRRVLYLSAERFMYQFVRAVRFKDTMAFKQQFRSAEVLMIDDVQFICGKDSTQEEFFHTFNALVDHNRQIVISGDRSPSDLDQMEERLRSRLGWGLVADIYATTYELRLGILQSKAELMGMPNIPKDVLEFLAHKITSNVRELEMALNRVAAHATLVGRAITLEMTQDVLRDALRASDRRITIEEIQRKVAEHYNIKLAEMSSERRARAVARPRQVAMYLAKQLTTRSLPEIGRKFGGRDHTTVMHAIRVIEGLRQSEPALAEDIELLRRLLGG